jgi:hypothetical protein
MTAFILPEPSGKIVYKPELSNSYGGKGCYYVGESEIEKPSEDVEYFAQMLADAIAALNYESKDLIDKLAAEARIAYHTTEDCDDPPAGWDSLSDGYRSRWRAVVRTILDNAP